MHHKLQITILRTAVASLAALIFASCSQEPDAHQAPREAKAYESIDVSTLSKPELLTHLQMLAQETSNAVAANQTIEFHRDLWLSRRDRPTSGHPPLL